MSAPLFKTEMKSNLNILLLFLAVIAMYAGIITAMYDPGISREINAMAESMPELFAAFGMQDPGNTLLDFLINYLYGFIMVVTPFIYASMMCSRLMAKYVDRGSMAYLLNTRCTRVKIAVTQFAVLFLGLFVLVAFTVALTASLSTVLFRGQLEMAPFLMLNLGLLSLHVFLGALCFVFASLFNETKYSVGIGAGLGTLFVLIQMLSQTSEEIEFLKYCTPLTLFQMDGLVSYEPQALISMGLLWLGAVILFVIALTGFKERDLPL